MFYIIETDTQLERLQSFGRLGGYVDIVPTNYFYHPKLTSTVEDMTTSAFCGL